MPLEDEVGDVIEKAMRRGNLTPDEVGRRAGVPAAKIQDAIDYRPALNVDELGRIARVLGLNEVGLCALASGRYPQPELGTLPFSVWPLQMPHGIGVANAYLVAECGSSRAVLFDTGADIEALQAVWPQTVHQLDAVFLTHVEAEHVGGLCEVVRRFGAPDAFIPTGAVAPCAQPIADGQTKTFGRIEVEAIATPGHSAAHNCYLVRAPIARLGPAMLVSGDLLFAGSVGGAFFSAEQLHASLRRVLAMVEPSTVIAPGHGPLTSVGTELKYNPFVV
ncbi:MAG: MBL fold metallo-hydrolase [Opitutus sp.]